MFALLTSLFGLTPASAVAGGGPENVLLVVNGENADSITVANHYVNLRDVPPSHVVYLDKIPTAVVIDVAAYRTTILEPLLAAMRGRGLSEQIDVIAFSTGFPTGVALAADLPSGVKLAGVPVGSLTGLTFAYSASGSKNAAAYTNLGYNRYFRPVVGAEQKQPTHGFRAWYGWGAGGELLEAGGERYILSAMLGVGGANGNTPAETLADLRSSAKADGTRPAGTFYFSDHGDVRSKTRVPQFAAAVAALEKLGRKAEIVPDVFLKGRKDVLGATLGFTDRNTVVDDVRFLPGAIVENLTSYGGKFDGGHGQALLTQMLRLGAGGSSGTVEEPLAIPAKFPHAFVHVHYARGCTLAESFYQAVQGPYQLLIVGDPLCAPWAVVPKIDVPELPSTKTLLSGAVELKPTAALADGIVDRFELFVDGARVARCAKGDALTLDTRKFADGAHDVRVVGIAAGPIETQGRWSRILTFENQGKRID
ncbi:MAG: hypothetical protein QM811_02350 [Pirellulales bacterium]